MLLLLCLFEKTVAFIYLLYTVEYKFSILTDLIEIRAALFLDALMNGSSWIQDGIDAGCLRRRRFNFVSSIHRTCRHRDARRCAVNSSGGNPDGEKGWTIRIARETKKDRDGRGGRDGPEEKEEEEEKERWNGLGWVGG